MAVFRYSMQNILDVKLKLENQAKIAYGEANLAYMEQERILTELVLKRTRYEQELKRLMEGSLDVKQINQLRGQVADIKTLARRQMIEVHKAQRVLDDARNHLNQVMQERKTQEKLKEKAFDRFKEELAKAEEKEIDELVSYSFQKNMD